MAADGHFGLPICAKTIGFFHYYVLSMAMPNMKLIGEFMTKLEHRQVFAHLCKMAAIGHFVFRLMPKIIGFL